MSNSTARCLLASSLLVAAISAAAQNFSVEWPAAGGDTQGTRYSAAAALTPANVGTLIPAWTFHTGETAAEFATSKTPSFEATPLMLNGVLYFSTPLGRVFALNAASGATLWMFDPRIARNLSYGDFTNRGVASWQDKLLSAGTPCQHRIFAATAQSQLIALDASSGQPCTGFGNNGSVDLKVGLRIAPFEPQAYTITSAPLVANDLVIVGSSIGDNSRPNPASGEVRAFDARSGALRWSWDPIPQNASDPAYSHWQPDQSQTTGAANSWASAVADPERDLVFIPTSSAAPDYYGALRLGDNRHANSIVALKLSTGQLQWEFQTVHHDLWDYDNASPPALVTIKRNNRDIPAVLQSTKTGMLFVLNRETGEPIFPVEERTMPASTISGERTAPTQPFTALTPPLSAQQLNPKEIWALNAEDRASCTAAMAPLRYEGIFTPPSTQGTLVYPSNIGGSHWGGVAVDTQRQIAVVPVNNLAALVQLIPREQFDSAKFREEDRRLGRGNEYNRMLDTPYVLRRRILQAPSGLPCTPPPWGTLVAVDLSSGKLLWNVPLGSFTGPFSAELRQQIKAEWGSPNLGGPVITAGGLVFIGAAIDRKLHAYDIRNGHLLWQGELPASGKATPMSYELDGQQYVAIAAGSTDEWERGDSLVVFKLPASK